MCLGQLPTSTRASDYHTTELIGDVVPACCPGAWAATQGAAVRHWFVERNYFHQGLPPVAGGLYDQPAIAIEAFGAIDAAEREAHEFLQLQRGAPEFEP